jgi:hypothetical protein
VLRTWWVRADQSMNEAAVRGKASEGLREETQRFGIEEARLPADFGDIWRQSSCRLRHPETMKMERVWSILEDDSLRDKVGMFLVL